MGKRTADRAVSHPREYWRRHYQQWRTSSLSKADYCRKHDLYAGTFYNWCHTFGKSEHSAARPTANNAPLQLIPVQVNAESLIRDATVNVSCANVTLTLPANLPPEQIEHWLGTVVRLHA